MIPNLLTTIIWPLVIAFSSSNPGSFKEPATEMENPPARVMDIALPQGFIRVAVPDKSFAFFLRHFPLKKDNTVYLYNGRRKPFQLAQFAVLDLSTGTEDLQQCADAIMRLRADYLFEQKRFTEISFSDNNGKKYNSPINPDRRSFDRYLRTVYSWCGTLSLEKQFVSL